MTLVQQIGTALFVLAVLHTFLVGRFEHFAHYFNEGSVRRSALLLLGEVEIVFGFWAGLFILALAAIEGPATAAVTVNGLDFKEPIFVFAIMAMAATRPVLKLAERLLALPSLLAGERWRNAIFYATVLIIGPLLGSFITEPGAMTVCAAILLERFYSHGLSRRAQYATLAALLVNVSVGGSLTHFAAPPVLMVAERFHWDTPFMLETFGWRAALAVACNTGFALALSWKDIMALPHRDGAGTSEQAQCPWWLMAAHVVLLGAVVLSSHYLFVFIGFFLFFIGVTEITQKYQSPIELRKSLLVGFFLAGLVVLGSVQEWWLAPLLHSAGAVRLYFGATALTTITDNAALTYLGSQVPNLSDLMKYALVAGSLSGGGMTVIANAPNPAAFSILNQSFGEDGISPLWLFVAAILPTLIVIISFWYLRG